MSAGNLQSGSGRIQESWETLRTRWSDVREQWRDVNAADFEEQHLRKLAEAIQLAIPAISQMSTTMRAMQRELADERHHQGLDF
jgi:hypothetical protein